MNGADYKAVLAYMEEHDKETPDNPFGRMDAPAAGAQDGEAPSKQEETPKQEATSGQEEAPKQEAPSADADDGPAAPSEGDGGDREQ